MAAMTSSLPSVGLEEYLRSSYNPDVEYVDGDLQERYVGEIEHSDLQGELIAVLRGQGATWGIRAFPEQRVQVSERNYRVPDICVMPRSWKKTPIIHDAPLLCIEILSPEDSFSRTLQKCRDYLTMGVPEVWVFDPYIREAHILKTDGRITVQRDGELRLGQTELVLDVQSIFAALDQD